MSEGGKIYEQIPKIMAAIGAIGKDRKNPQQGYQFRGIDDVYNACNAALAEHGVFSAPRVLDISREERTNKNGGMLMYTVLTVEYTFFASDGSNFKCVTIGEAMDSGDKSANKSMSAAQKYAFLQVFAIPTIEPKDTENETHEPVSKGTQGPKAQNAAKPSAPKTQPKPSSDKDHPTVRGIIDEVRVSTGENSKGKWTRYGVFVGGNWYGSFSKTIGDASESLKGTEVILSYSEEGEHKTIIELLPVPIA